MSDCMLSPAQQKRAALGYTFKTLVVAVPIVFIVVQLVSRFLFGPSSQFASSWFGAAVGGVIGASIPTYFSYRNLLNPDYHGSSSVDRSRYLTLQMPYERAFQRCLESLFLFGDRCVVIEDRAHGQIEAALVPGPFWEYTLTGLGQRISFRLGSDQAGVTQVLVMSKASLSVTIFDFGKNERNLSRISAFLQESSTSSEHVTSVSAS